MQIINQWEERGMQIGEERGMRRGEAAVIVTAADAKVRSGFPIGPRQDRRLPAGKARAARRCRARFCRLRKTFMPGCQRTVEYVTMQPKILNKLASDDDPQLWEAVGESIFADFPKTEGLIVEIGRCSHWLRPHQTRWTAAGGFAWPSGYGGHSFSRSGLPLFDWSVMLKRTSGGWELVSDDTAEPSLRITIPSRTAASASSHPRPWHERGRSTASVLRI